LVTISLRSVGLKILCGNIVATAGVLLFLNLPFECDEARVEASEVCLFCVFFSWKPVLVKHWDGHAAVHQVGGTFFWMEYHTYQIRFRIVCISSLL